MKILAFFLLVPALSSCHQVPEAVQVDFARLTSRVPLTVRVNTYITINGFAPEAVEILDNRILQAVSLGDETSGPSPVQATYVAKMPGQTELIVTQSMCQTITANCGEPALYYRLQVHVH